MAGVHGNRHKRTLVVDKVAYGHEHEGLGKQMGELGR